MMKGCGILAAAYKLDDPKSITTNQKLARQFCECTAEMDCQCHGLDAECLEALLTFDANDQKRGFLSVLESYAKVKRSNYESAAEQCEKLKAEQDKCHYEMIELHAKWGEIEQQRVNVVEAKTNIDRMPDIVEDRKQIEKVRAYLDT
eukprot:734302_1